MGSRERVRGEDKIKQEERGTGSGEASGRRGDCCVIG